MTWAMAWAGHWTGCFPEVVSRLRESVSLAEALLVPGEAVLYSWGPRWIHGPCARSLLPLPGCGAISFSLQSKTARCYKQYYCVANKTNNLVDGITFGHMVHFLKYFFVLSLFPHSSHTFDFWLPLKSKLISLNTFMTSGWGVQTGFVSHPAKQVASSFLLPWHRSITRTKIHAVSSSSSHNGDTAALTKGNPAF